MKKIDRDYWKKYCSGCSIVALLTVLLLGCQSSKILTPDVPPVFPLHAGTYWKYHHKRAIEYSWNDSVDVSIDTITMTIDKPDSNGEWTNLLIFKEGSNGVDNAIAGVKILNNDLYVKNFTLLEDILPRDSITDNGYVLLRFNNDSLQWTIPHSNKIMRKRKDMVKVPFAMDTLTDTLNCYVIDDYVNNKKVGSLFYTSTGIIKKVFTPDTVAVGSDKIITTSSLKLIQRKIMEK